MVSANEWTVWVEEGIELSPPLKRLKEIILPVLGEGDGGTVVHFNVAALTADEAADPVQVDEVGTVGAEKGGVVEEGFQLFEVFADQDFGAIDEIDLGIGAFGFEVTDLL